MKKIWLMLYYGFARFLSAYPIPGYQLAYSIRRSICKKLFLKMGGGTLIKRNAYFGDGHGILIGENSQIGLNAVLSTDVTLGDNVVMGPDVIIYSNSHEYADVNIPINQQGRKKSNPVTIGNNVWIGARVVILPGVTIGDNCIIGANTVVTKSVPANSVVTGHAGRVVKTRT